MKSTALRLAVAAATIVSMGAPAAFAASNISATVNPFANFTATVFKNVTSSNMTNTTQLGGGFASPSNQTLVTGGAASATANTTVAGNASNTVNLTQFGF
jgi:hypothetical protein